MWLYRASAQSIASDPYLLENLESDYQAQHVHNRAAGPGDVKAWRRSVTHLAQELKDSGLGHVHMFVEYDLDPALSGEPPAPIDVVLAGSHPQTGEPSYMVVELKQWSSLERVEGDPAKVFVPQYSRNKAHPAVQVDRGRQRLLKHLDAFTNGYVTLVALAYLHNLNSDSTQWITDYSPSPATRVITGRTPRSLRSYLRAHLSDDDRDGAAVEAAQRLAESQILPASPLQAIFGDVLAGRFRFNLIDEQREAFEKITQAVQKPTGATQDVFLIEGRPGTGKSVVAVHLLKWAIDHGYSCRYVSGGSAARETFKRNSRGQGNLFITLNKLANEYAPKSVDIVIVDEAHRVTQFPLINSAGTMREGEETIDIALSRARIPVFFIDEDQRIRPNEIVSVSRIEERARGIAGAALSRLTLPRPMRGASSPTYDTWTKRLLGSPRPAPLPWTGEDPFKLVLADSPAAMEDLLRERLAEGFSARIAAGYCWKWSPPRTDGTLVDDVKIGGWHRPWNVKGAAALGDAPPSQFWATAQGGFEQIGCVYTAQGLEYDWAGIILGGDLVWRDGAWKAVPEASHDRKVKVGASLQDFELSVRNAYTILLTRAMCGAVVYSVDPETQEFLRGLIA